MHPRDKSLRACYRAAFYECALYDHSYECVIEVAGSQEQIVSAFRALMAPGGAASPASLAYAFLYHICVRLCAFVIVDLSKTLRVSFAYVRACASAHRCATHSSCACVFFPTRTCRFINGARAGYGLMHRRLQYPRGTIAPFRFLWRPLPTASALVRIFNSCFLLLICSKHAYVVLCVSECTCYYFNFYYYFYYFCSSWSI